MQLIVFGFENTWYEALTILEEMRPDIEVMGLSSLHPEKFQDVEVVYTLEQVQQLHQYGLIDGILFTSPENLALEEKVVCSGIRDIYVIPRSVYVKRTRGEETKQDEVLVKYQESHWKQPELENLEFHLADHCNLNCRGCSHFSNLVPEPVFAEYGQFEKDIRRLGELFSNIKNFFFLGGEPLLGHDIEKYIELVSSVFPYSKIIIVSNGLLVRNMSEELIQLIKENDVSISISNYITLDENKVRDFAERHGLNVSFRNGKEGFTKYINSQGDSDKEEIFAQCIRRDCNFLGKGKISTCCMPFVVHYFNDYFGEKIPEQEAIDLYESGMDGRAMKQWLASPMETCRYCARNQIFQWEPSKGPFQKEEWCVK